MTARFGRRAAIYACRNGRSKGISRRPTARCRPCKADTPAVLPGPELFLNPIPSPSDPRVENQGDTRCNARRNPSSSRRIRPASPSPSASQTGRRSEPPVPDRTLSNRSAVKVYINNFSILIPCPSSDTRNTSWIFSLLFPQSSPIRPLADVISIDHCLPHRLLSPSIKTDQAEPPHPAGGN